MLPINESNKVNKKSLIDVIVNKSIPTDLSSDILRNFFIDLFGGVVESEISEESISPYGKFCEVQEIIFHSSNREIKHLQKLNDSLELRILDLGEMVQLLKNRNNHPENDLTTKSSQRPEGDRYKKILKLFRK